MKGATMKKLVTTTEVEGEGLMALLGEHVTLWCECYIYAGKLTGVNETCVLLEDAKIVYETGPLNESGFSEAQPLPSQWYIQTAKIESFGAMK